MARIPEQITSCLIWGMALETSGSRVASQQLVRVDDSPRAGGAYEIRYEVIEDHIDLFSLEEKARLTTWLINQREQGSKSPLIDKEAIESVKNQRSLQVHERADRLLRFISDNTKPVGTPYDMRRLDPRVYAWSESTEDIEIGHFLDYLVKQGWLDTQHNPGMETIGSYLVPRGVRVTVDGHGHIAKQLANVDSGQAFVAMWFGDNMKEVYDNGIAPAIMAAGYKPFRIDQADYLGRVEDKIIAEIRRSRFVVADFTHGEDGVRGGVYYEAGFAFGLNLPVIPMCKKNKVDKDPKYLHFDTSHLNHILWTDPEDLRIRLRDRIEAVISEGPKKSTS